MLQGELHKMLLVVLQCVSVTESDLVYILITGLI